MNIFFRKDFTFHTDESGISCRTIVDFMPYYFVRDVVANIIDTVVNIIDVVVNIRDNVAKRFSGYLFKSRN